MSLNATNLYIQASPIPATFKGTPNDLYSEMIKRMRRNTGNRLPHKDFRQPN